MTTTTMYLTDRPARHAIGATPRRARVRRPIVDLAPWIAPLAWMTALAIFIAGIGAIAVVRERVPSGSSTTIIVRVAPHDTLWSIAEANKLPGVSTAATVEVITAANDLGGSPLAPGSTLKVPAAGVPSAALAQAQETPAAH